VEDRRESMELNLFVKELFSKAQEEGFSEYEVYYVDRESLSISVYKEEVEKYNLNNSAGLSFRGKFGDRIGYSYTEILDEDAIEMLVKKAKENVLAIENNDIQFIYEGDKEYKEISTYHEELEDIPADKLINIAISMEKEAKKYCNKVESFSGCSVSYSSGKYGIINSKGLNLSNKSNLLTAYVVPIVKDLDKMYDGCGYVVAKSLNDVKPDKIAKMGVDEALSKIGGTSIASGNYKVIINNEAMVSLLSTFAGIFSGDAVQKGLSLLKDKEGEIIAADIVNLVDDPHLEDGLASVSFDDEGVATLKTYLIKNGKLNSLLHNLKTANKAGVKSTGNGFKSSYASPISVSPTNFYIEPGINSLEEMTKKINKGLIITDFAGLHSGANSITGDFSLAAKGFYIEDGIKTHPVEQITVAGNFFTLLNNIEEIGSDLKFPMSSVGSPSIVIKELSIAGEGAKNE
jgi:PmbA protein